VHAVWSWLSELVAFDRDVSAEEAAQAFTDAGLEVESMTTTGAALGNVVVAQVVGKRPHPNADRLTLVDVIDRPEGEKTEVVCGAPNVPEPGGLVLWAQPGAVLPGNLAIGKRAVKGVDSAGMLCAEDELGLGDDHAGIIVLSAADVLSGAGTLLGDPRAMERLGLRDTVFEIGVHANRPDALGHVGLARELAALLGGTLRPVSPALDAHIDDSDDSLHAAALVSVTIDDAQGCPRYLARIIDGVSVKPSPLWMRQRLRAVGVRPLSNLVDITNYVMFELGQPQHAFDYGHVAGGHVQVRRARPGERMVTLDDVERVLEPQDLLICDRNGPVALAGVMGGASSEVSQDTTRVLLETASFHPADVRRTAQRLGLHSESSHRFERGVDPNGVDLASRRAAELMARLGGGKVAAGAVDAYARSIEPWKVPVRASRTTLITGVEFDRAGARAMLERLGLEVADDADDPDRMHVTCPTYRPDLTREIDLIEEVIRVHGVHKVPATLPASSVPRTRVDDPRPALARRALVAAGMTEAITYGFTSRERAGSLRLPAGDARTRWVAVKNPMTVDQAVMRTSLLPNLLAAVAHNLSFGITDIRLFEVGSVFLARGADELPDEPVHITGVMTGRRAGWLRDGCDVDFFDIKGVVERLLASLCGLGGPGTDSMRLAAAFAADSSVPYMHPGVCASVTLDGVILGHLGEIHPEVRRAHGIEPACFGFDFALAGFPVKAPTQMREIPRYPAITRDVSLFVDEALPAGRVRALIDEAAEPLIERVAILEEYRDPAYVPAGKKGLLWTITYRSATGTLTDAHVDAAHEAIVARLVETLPAQRR
jgi:phenylalanyl-tRNA synthetase beta chain